MSTIALFHSVLGVRPGITGAADRLRAASHDVVIVDQYDGRSFDDYTVASQYVDDIGFPVLMEKAMTAVADLRDDLVVVGFSNGGGMAEYAATQRPVAGVVLASGTLPLEMIGADHWPADVPAQIHYTTHDPYREQSWVDSVVATIEAAGVPLEVYDSYPGSGHLFTDPSLPNEYDPEAAEAFYQRLLAFCRRVTTGS